MSLSKEQKDILACRFCHMCRHVCPIGKQTGKEIHHARGRALVLSTVLKNNLMNAEIAESVYECGLCGACVNQCVTGYDPTIFTRAARTEAAIAGLVPAKVQKVIDNLSVSGNPYGFIEEKVKNYEDLIKDLPEKAEVLLFIGCAAAYQTPEMARAAISLLKKAGINFTVSKDEECCGLYLNDLIGSVAESKQQAEKVVQQIRKTGAKTLVALCPSCTKVFKREYLEWGLELMMEVKSLTAYLADLIVTRKLLPRPLTKKVTFHDPCRLARDLEESEPSRNILNSLGVELKEMFRNKNNTNCCGGGLLNEYGGDLTALTSKGRWEEALRTGAEALVVACPSCKQIMGKDKPENMELSELVELLWRQCQ